MIALKAWAQQVSATVKMRPRSRSWQVKGVYGESKGNWMKHTHTQTHICATHKYTCKVSDSFLYPIVYYCFAHGMSPP